jgi:hypothetical protein
MAGHLLNGLANQAILVESRPYGQSGEFYLAIFGDFIPAINNRCGLRLAVDDQRLTRGRYMNEHTAFGPS